MENWEYLVKRDLDDKDLNLYGIDGWELVTILAIGLKGEDRMEYAYFFKRPATNELKGGWTQSQRQIRQ